MGARGNTRKPGRTRHKGPQLADTTTPGPPAGRRSDAGRVRLTGRDVTGLTWCADMYGVPYDLLAACLAVREDRLRAITARWRRAGYVQTARLGPGPAWCWLTRPGLHAAGLAYHPAPPSLARLAHLRAVAAVRLSLEAGPAWETGQAYWRSERRIRRAQAGAIPAGHLPDAEVSWPEISGSPYAGEMWAIEAELTPKPAARTAAIMRGLLARTTGYSPGSAPRPAPRYARVVYLTAPAARSVCARAAAALPAPLAARVTVRDLPDGALLP
jgi:hypothetical protein